ncbi:hypothetical protein U1Q18_028201, partial [Sarracenia purpurea var. burkii]
FHEMYNNAEHAILTTALVVPQAFVYLDSLFSVLHSDCCCFQFCDPLEPKGLHSGCCYVAWWLQPQCWLLLFSDCIVAAF